MPIERRKSQQPFSGPERRKGPGRPPFVEGETAPRLTIRLPSNIYDAAWFTARHSAGYNGNISAVIREALILFLQRDLSSENTPDATLPAE